MRRLLISVAVLALATTSAFAQPGHDHDRGGGGPGHGGGHERGGPPPGAAPQAQPQMHANGAPRPLMAQGGGPTNFTNQVPQGHQPDQGQRQERGDRGPRQAPQAQAAPQAAPQPDRGGRERGNWQGRGARGPQAAPAPQPVPQQVQRDQKRGNWQGNRGNNDRDFRGGDRRAGNPGFRGQRRDFSSFRDFHRDFRSNRRFRIAPYRPPAGFYAHHWTFGEFLPRPYWVRDYWLVDFAAYGLEPPPYGAIWVRVGTDALLIDEDSGEVITVAYDVFY